MKRFWFIIILAFLLAAPINAASLNVKWNANTEADLAGYKVLWIAPTDAGWTLTNGKWIFTGLTWTHIQDVGNALTYSIPNIVLGPYAVGVKAYDTAANISPLSIPATALYALETTTGIPPIDVPPGVPITIIVNVLK